MNMSRRLFSAITFLLISAGTVTAQKSLTPESRKLIEHGLDAMGMVVEDCAMPPDYYSADAHRVAFHDRLFSRPLQAIDDVHAYGTEVPGPTVYEKMMKDMQLGAYRRVTYSMTMTPADMQKTLGRDVTANLDAAEAMLLQRILEGMVQAIQGDRRVASAIQLATDTGRSMRLAMDEHG